MHTVAAAPSFNYEESFGMGDKAAWAAVFTMPHRKMGEGSTRFRARLQRPQWVRVCVCEQTARKAPAFQCNAYAAATLQKQCLRGPMIDAAIGAY